MATSFAQMGKQILKLSDAELNGNIKKSKLLEKYLDILNNEYLKGRMTTEQYNELLNEYRLSRGQETINYNISDFIINRVPPEKDILKIKHQKNNG